MENMTFGKSIKTCFKKYAVFKGRAARAEFWWFILFLLLLELAASFIGGLLMVPLLLKGNFTPDAIQGAMMPVTVGYGAIELALLLPSLGVLTRRLHDTNKSGWWIVAYYVLALVLLALLFALSLMGVSDYAPDAEMPTGIVMAFAFLGLLLFAFCIVLLVWCVKRGTVGPNRYGPDPLEAAIIDVPFTPAPAAATASQPVESPSSAYAPKDDSAYAPKSVSESAPVAEASLEAPQSEE